MSSRDELLTRRGFLTVAGVTGVGLVAAACAPTAAPATPTSGATVAPAAAKRTFTPATVKVGTIEGITENVIWRNVGVEKGFFAEYGITIQVQGLRDGNAITAGVQSGQLDLADGGPGTVLAAIEKGATMKLIGNSRPGLNFVVYSQKNINSLKDLEGRSVGTAAPGSFLNLLMLALFDAQGVNKDRVTFVNIGASPDVYKAVVAGKVDAGPASVSFTATADKDGVKPLVETWKVLPNYMRVSFYAADDTIRKMSDELARTMAGFARSHRFLRDDPAAKDLFIKAAVEQLKVEPAVAEFEYNFLKSNPILSYDLEITEQQVRYMQELNVAAGSQTRILPFDRVVDVSVLRKAQEYLKT